MKSKPSAPHFTTLVQDFFCQRLIQQQNASAQTVASYRDTFRLLLGYLEQSAIAQQFKSTEPSAEILGGNASCCGPNNATEGLAGVKGNASVNAPLALIRLKIFMCPGDSGDPLLPATGVYAVGYNSNRGP